MTIPSRFHDVDAVRAAHGRALVDRIMLGTTVADPPADRFVAEVRGGDG